MIDNGLGRAVEHRARRGARRPGSAPPPARTSGPGAISSASLRERAERAEHERELRAEQAKVGERARIAREMHDVLAHKVSLIALHAGALEVNADDERDTSSPPR